MSLEYEMGESEKGQRVRAANIKMAIVLGLLALAVFVAFILVNV